MSYFLSYCTLSYTEERSRGSARLDKNGEEGQNKTKLMPSKKTSPKGKKKGGDLLVPCLCFDKPGPQNTLRTLQIAAARAEELAINDIVVASSSGKTGLQAATFFSSKNLVMVTHSTGFLRPDFQELKPALRRKIEALGGTRSSPIRSAPSEREPKWPSRSASWRPMPA
jgi:hypothetical protein